VEFRLTNSNTLDLVCATHPPDIWLQEHHKMTGLRQARSGQRGKDAIVAARRRRINGLNLP
jgi:hypothetical protein